MVWVDVIERREGLVKPNSTQLSAMTRLFSSAVFREMATKGRSSLFARLFALTDIAPRRGGRPSVGEAFDATFNVLKTVGQRDQYIYRSAITHNVLMGKHSLKTACMLSEFRTGACKADLAILNGTATVYEIKSERDSLARLATQVANYKKVFASVYVIASERHIKDVFNIVPNDVGLMVLGPRYQIKQIREADDRPARICPVTVFDSLRSTEAAAILKRLKLAVPDVPNTRRHAAMRALFVQLDPAAVHKAMVNTLKRTRDLAPLGDLVADLPRSLHAAALSVQIRRADHVRLVEAVSTPLDAAMGWA